MANLPADVEVRELLPEGVHYILPPRMLGKARRWAKAALVIGGFVGIAALAWFALSAWRMVAGGKLNIGGIVPTLFMLPITSFAFTVAAFGSFLLYGHAEILLADGTLTARERSGWLRKNWKRRIDSIERLEVVEALARPTDGAAPLRLPGDYYRIKAGDIFLAPGYPRELCFALAEDLRRRWPKNNSGDSNSTAPEVIESSPFGSSIVGETAVAPPPLVQPTCSTVEVTDTADSLTLRVPPAGIRKGSKGLIFFALFWNAFMIIFTLATVGAGFKHMPWLGIGLFLAAFWAVGIGMLVASVNMGWREAAIVVAAHRLMVIQKSIFGTKRREWAGDELDTIVSGLSHMEVNNIHLRQLQIRTTEGRKFAYFTGRDDDELEWLAGLLRERLDLPHEKEHA